MIEIFSKILHILAVLSIAVGQQCLFESEMHGSWFQSGRGHQPPVVVNGTHFSDGECVEIGKANRYLVYFRKDNCHKCVVINMKHHNVIQYKESYCDTSSKDLSKLCHRITGDAILFSMFRLKSSPVRCPFSGPLTFTYSKGYGECSSPVSQVDSCSEDSRLLFRQQACADVLKSESREEELVCLATWKDGSNYYLAGKLNHTHANSDEDRYRCFIYENPADKEKKYRAITGESPPKNAIWHLSVSADATCQGLVTAHEGSKTMKMKKVSLSSKRCRFPAWFTKNSVWHSLDFSQSYTVHRHNTSIRIEPGHLKPKTPSDIRLICYEYKSANIQRSRIQETHENQVTLVTHFTTGCRSGYKCMGIYRRHSNVIQIQLGQEAVTPSEACTPYYWKPHTEYMSTVVSPYDTHGDCGPMGRYQVSDFDQSCESNPASSISQMAIGCSNIDSLELFATCPRKTVENYQCHTQWMNDGVMYVIASPVSRASGSPKRLCFAYVSDHQRLSESPQQIVFSSRKDTCMPSQDDAHFAFNATFFGNCITAAGISSSGTEVTLKGLTNHWSSYILTVLLVNQVYCC